LFDLKNINLFYVDKLATKLITVKVPSGTSLDPNTNKVVQTFTEYQIKAFVRQFSVDTVSHSNNFLTQEARRVIFQNTFDLTMDSIVVIDGHEYKIKQMSIKNGYYDLAVDKK